ALFAKWIFSHGGKPVSKTLNLGFFSKSFYPSMLALIVGAIVVVAGGVLFKKPFNEYFDNAQKGDELVEETGDPA
ncbi:MAG: hypothetical protein CVT63_08015, partial [Candidatus Anoxymicrobium japonicum]